MNQPKVPELPFSTYEGGRFSYLLKEPFARELWEYLSAASTIEKMVSAIDEGLPPLSPLLEHVEERFGRYITSKQFPDDDVGIMVNNMIKQIMEHVGFEHVACGILRQAQYIKLSGVYNRKDA